MDDQSLYSYNQTTCYMYGYCKEKVDIDKPDGTERVKDDWPYMYGFDCNTTRSSQNAQKAILRGMYSLLPFILYPPLSWGDVSKKLESRSI